MAVATRQARIATNGIELSCVVAGDRGDLVVLLHGFPQSADEWRHQIPALAERFQVVAPDLRGYGRSSKPRGIAAYRQSVLANDVVGLIRSFGVERAHVVGHDWGGAVAWTLALEHPEVLGRLVVMNCPHPAAMARALRTNPRQMRRSWYVLFFQLPWLPERLLTRPGAFRGPLRSARPGAFSDEDLSAYERAFSVPGVATAALNYYRAAFREGLRGRGTGEGRLIATPTLVIWGDADFALGPELVDGMARYFSGPLEIRHVPDCGHWVPEERPELVNRLVLDFLRSAGP